MSGHVRHKAWRGVDARLGLRYIPDCRAAGATAAKVGDGPPLFY
jgi:hypothetical protein